MPAVRISNAAGRSHTYVIKENMTTDRISITKQHRYLFLAAALLLTGCGGSGGGTLATVNDHKITSDEFDDIFGSQRLTFASAQNEFDTKREVIDSMIVTRLLIEAAYEKGFAESEELARLVLANKDKFLVDVMYEREVLDKVDPTELSQNVAAMAIVTFVLADMPDRIGH